MAESNQKFDDYAEWVDLALVWLTRRSPNERAICFDKNLQIIRGGLQFKKAEYPVRWIWPTQLITAVDGTDISYEIDAIEEETVNFMSLPDKLDHCQRRTLRYIIGQLKVTQYIRKNIDKDY